MGVVCFERGAEASRMGVFSLLLPTAMLKSFADTQFVCFYSGSLRHKFVPHFQPSPNWHLHFRLPATQPPPSYGRNSFTCPNLPLRLVLLHLTPESYLFVGTPRFPRPTSNPSFFRIPKPPLLFAHLIYPKRWEGGRIGRDQGKCFTFSNTHTSKRTASVASVVRRREQLRHQA